MRPAGSVAWGGYSVQKTGAPESTLPSRWHVGMVSHMKTTLTIDDGVMVRLKAEAARRRTTMSALVETALRLLLDAPASRRELPPLPSFDRPTKR